MELALNVFVILFVSIAVAFLVINLASDFISQGQEQIEQFTLTCEENADFFLEAVNVTGSQVANLVELCYNKNLGVYEGDKLCYIVHGSIAADATSSINPDLVSTIDIANAGQTLYVRFDERTQKVRITG